METSYPPELLEGPARPAAVLMPLLKTGDEWHLLFTRRKETLAEHSGQVAFPGGRIDPEDAGPTAAALREAWEEIGLIPEDVRVIGRLPDFLTVTNYRVTPVIGVIPWPYPIRLAVSEVSRIFTIPLTWLADAANREERLRSLPPPFVPIPVIYFKIYEGELLWGVSARLTLALLNLLFPP